jgi:hypothetical protein
LALGAGAVEYTFTGGNANTQVRSTIQGDGKIVVVGQIASSPILLGSTPLNPDGNLDTFLQRQTGVFS